MRKTLVIIFFIVVFGLPVAWYLFLQTFGENKFALPKLSMLDERYMIVERPTVLIDSAVANRHPNELDAIAQKVEENDLIYLAYFNHRECQTSEMLFVDEEGWIRSELSVNREEVDRLLAEIDIYILNQQNESEE